MSEAEKLGNVEDVLLSIRRLVADRPRAVSEQLPAETTEHLQEVDIIEMEPTEKPEPRVSSKNHKTEPTKRLASFVETMNASIAKITEETQIEDTSVADAKNREAQVDAFLESKTEETKQADESGEIIPEKPEPYILHSAIKPDQKSAENTREETEVETTTNAEPTVNDAGNPPEEQKTDFQVIHDEDAEEITMPDNIEDDEAALARENDADKPDAPFIDEDMLREIVSELVRTELQGDLGDRITRNVRKLVRREIHHALASRELD